MYKKPTSEELAQEAIELLDQAENFEEQKNWSKAIESYQKAADFLQHSGYLSHRIDDIYTRITEINNYLKEERAYQQSKAQIQQAQLDRLQDEAFSLLDEAKSQEKAGLVKNAVQKYLSAIKLLTQSGWTEPQLDNLKSKIMRLAEIYESQKQALQDSQVPIQPQPMLNEAAVQTQVGQKVDALAVYEAKKKREEENQNQAFTYIDEAKKFEKEKNFNEAIESYQKAIELLKSIGWTQQTQNIQAIVEKLKKESEKFKIIQTQQQQDITSLEKELFVQPPFPQSELNLKRQKIIEFEEKKKKEKEIQNQAFNLIDTGKKLERERKYDDAINKFEQSINLLKFIGWDSYIQPIIHSINDINEKKEREIKAEQVKRKREDEINEIQKMIREKQKEKFIETAQDTELRRIEFERKRLEESQVEKQFFPLLDNAGKYLKKSEPDFDKGISLYIQARNILEENIGWEPEINIMDSLIEDLQGQKARFFEKRILEEQAKFEREQEYISFQQELKRRITEYEEEKEKRRIDLREFEERRRLAEELKEKGLNLIDEGKRLARFGEFNNAQDYFNKAITLFREMGWGSQIHYIETEIKNTKILEERTREEELERQRIHEELETQANLQIQRRQEEDQKIRQSIGEIGNLAVEVEKMIENKKEQLIIAEQQKKERIKIEAKEFSRKMGKMFKLKQEIVAELAISKEQSEKKEKEIQKAKEREEVDEIARMIKEASKKKKQ